VGIMDNRYKYIYNMGLAFDENRVVKKFAEFAKEGWILKEMGLFRYKLEKSEPAELVFSMDYKELKKDKEEYFDLFESSGWTHRCSYGPYHFFSANYGTVPIYTDKENYFEKYKVSKGIYLKLLIVSILLLIITTLIKSYLADDLNNNLFDTVLFIIGILSAGIAAPSFMVTIAYLLKFKKGDIL
jgi:hypothetical protein